MELGKRGLCPSFRIGDDMPNKWTDPCNLKRRLISNVPSTGEVKCLLWYWQLTKTPIKPDPDYPGEPMLNDAYNEMLLEAQKYIGEPYLWGGKTPPYFDCSGYVGYCYKYAGIMPNSVVAYTGTIWDWCSENGTHGDDINNAVPGDLVFWGDYPHSYGYTGNAHVAIYVGNGYILDAASKGVDYRVWSWHNTAAKYAGYWHLDSNE